MACTVVILGFTATGLFAWQARQGDARERDTHIRRLADSRTREAELQLRRRIETLHLITTGWVTAGQHSGVPTSGYRNHPERQPHIDPALRWAVCATPAGGAAAPDGCEHHFEILFDPRGSTAGLFSSPTARAAIDALTRPPSHCAGHTARLTSLRDQAGSVTTYLLLGEHLPSEREGHPQTAPPTGKPRPNVVVLAFDASDLIEGWQVLSADQTQWATDTAWTATDAPSWRPAENADAVICENSFRIADLLLQAELRQPISPPPSTALADYILAFGGGFSLLLAALMARVLESIRRRAIAEHVQAASQELARQHLEARAVTFEAAVQSREAELRSAREALLNKARELITSNRQLARRTREIEGFYHTVSHELRTPLTAIREFLSIVDDELVGPVSIDQHDCLKSADESCVQMQRCIDDLFDAARSETGKLELLPTQTDLTELLHHTTTACAQAATLQRVVVHCQNPPLPSAYVDANRIRQVLTNLIDNAVKFSPPDSVVRVRASLGTEDGPSEVLFNIVDEGPGISPDELARVFDRLHQVRTDDLQTRGGLGLGLSLCRCLVERHGGRIGLDSVVGRGTTAWFTLPLQSTAAAPTGTPQTIPSPSAPRPTASPETVS